MAQQTLAEQIAEMQNNLIALDKIINAPVAPATQKVGRIVVEYEDGTEDIFVKHVPLKLITDDQTKSILSQLRKRNLEKETEVAADPKPKATLPNRIGYSCILDGVKYNSLIHAERVLGMSRHTIKANIERGMSNWSYA
jgi:hypothetical protein